MLVKKEAVSYFENCVLTKNNISSAFTEENKTAFAGIKISLKWRQLWVQNIYTIEFY